MPAIFLCVGACVHFADGQLLNTPCCFYTPFIVALSVLAPDNLNRKKHNFPPLNKTSAVQKLTWRGCFSFSAEEGSLHEVQLNEGKKGEKKESKKACV